MGHRVSTARHGDSASRHNGAAVAASLAVLLAVASATSNTAAPSCHSGYCGCFVSQQPQSSWPQAISEPASSLHATSGAIAAATVPPPNSRLGRLRQQSQSFSPQRQPPGTKRSQRTGVKGKDSARRTDLGYASYGSHYAQYNSGEEPSANKIDEGEFPSWGKHAFRKGFATPRAHATEEESDEDSIAIAEASAANNARKRGNDKRYVQNNSTAAAARSRRRRRARMLRFLDRRFARLQFDNRQSARLSSSYTARNKGSSSLNKDASRRLDYEERKAAWAAKYTSASALRKSFGKNRNRIWGDYDPTTTRKLYHTLLPRALLELKGLRDGLLANTGKTEDADGKKKGENARSRIRPTREETEEYNVIDDFEGDDETYLQQELKELAPLAYQARLAAKKYARERSRLPGRVFSMAYDGYRSWRRYGKWKSSGMTWEQVWNKYEDQVLREAMEELEDDAAKEADGLFDGGSVVSREELDDEELTARICMRILERSVVTNDAIDRLFLKRLADDDDEARYEGLRDEESTQDVMRFEESRRSRRRRQARRKLEMQADLRSIEREFDDDIRELLRYGNLTTREGEERRDRRRRRGAFFWEKSGGGSDGADGEDGRSRREGRESKESRDGASSSVAGTAADIPSQADLASAMFSMSEVSAGMDLDEDDANGKSAAGARNNGTRLRKLAVHEVFALRILATTKQRITSLQALPQLGGGSTAESDGTATDRER